MVSEGRIEVFLDAFLTEKITTASLSTFSKVLDSHLAEMALGFHWIYQERKIFVFFISSFLELVIYKCLFDDK